MTLQVLAVAAAACLIGLALTITGTRRFRGVYGYGDGETFRGLVSIAGGLVLLAGMFHFLTMTPPQVAAVAPAGPSASDLARLEAALTLSRSEVAERKTELETLKPELVEIRSALTTERQAHVSHLTTILETIHSARGTISGSDLTTRSIAGAANSDETADEKQSRALKEINDLGRMGAASSRTVAADPSAMRDVMNLRDKMGVEMHASDYDVSLYPDNEVVSGKKGRYYVIDLKEAKSGVRYYFQPGRYTIDKRAPEFRASLNAFAKDVLETMHGKVEYQLMVRGSADKAPFSGQLEPGHEFKQIAYLRSAGDDRYVTDLTSTMVNATIANSDLPNLRAAFLQKIIGDAYPLKNPIILEGTVSPRIAEGDRNAELLLFVNW